MAREYRFRLPTSRAERAVGDGTYAIAERLEALVEEMAWNTEKATVRNELLASIYQALIKLQR